jgi:hypothetical protein
VSAVRYPEVEVQLTGEAGNACAILARVLHALRHAGVPETDLDAFEREATSRDYDFLLQTCMRWVSCA